MTKQSMIYAWINTEDPLKRPTEMELQLWARKGARREAMIAIKRLIIKFFG